MQERQPWQLKIVFHDSRRLHLAKLWPWSVFSRSGQLCDQSVSFQSRQKQEASASRLPLKVAEADKEETPDGIVGRAAAKEISVGRWAVAVVSPELDGISAFGEGQETIPESLLVSKPQKKLWQVANGLSWQEWSTEYNNRFVLDSLPNVYRLTWIQ